MVQSCHSRLSGPATPQTCGEASESLEDFKARLTRARRAHGKSGRGAAKSLVRAKSLG
jgi:hypothetical protein